MRFDVLLRNDLERRDGGDHFTGPDGFDDLGAAGFGLGPRLSEPDGWESSNALVRLCAVGVDERTCQAFEPLGRTMRLRPSPSEYLRFLSVGLSRCTNPAVSLPMKTLLAGTFFGTP